MISFQLFTESISRRKFQIGDIVKISARNVFSFIQDHSGKTALAILNKSGIIVGYLPGFSGYPRYRVKIPDLNNKSYAIRSAYLSKADINITDPSIQSDYANQLTLLQKSEAPLLHQLVPYGYALHNSDDMFGGLIASRSNTDLLSIPSILSNYGLTTSTSKLPTSTIHRMGNKYRVRCMRFLHHIICQSDKAFKTLKSTVDNCISCEQSLLPIRDIIKAAEQMKQTTTGSTLLNL